MIAVQRIAAAAEIIIPAIRREHVIDPVVKALEAEAGPLLISLCRMVEHHVQNNLDPVLMECPDQLLQLRPFPVELIRRRIAGVRGKKADRIVAPVIQQPPPIHFSGVHGFVKFKNRHQLHRIDAELLQIGNLFLQPGERSLVCHAGRHVAGKAPHMQLVDDQVAQLPPGLRHTPPVKHIPHHPGMVMLFLMLSPDALARHRPGIGVQKDGVFIKAQPLLRLPRPVDAVGIFKFPDIQAENDHGVHIPNPVFLRKGQHRIRFFLAPVKKQQLAACPLMSMHGEIHALRKGHRPV